jgi:hypothetical protein
VFRKDILPPSSWYPEDIKLVNKHYNTDKVRCPLCLGEQNAKQILLDCWETRNWGLEFLNNDWLNMNQEVACRKMLRYTGKEQIRNLGTYLVIVKCKRFDKQNKCKYISIKYRGLPP